MKSRACIDIIFICGLYLTIGASAVRLTVEAQVGTDPNALCETVLLFEVIGNKGAAVGVSHAGSRLINTCGVFAGTHGEGGTNPGDRYPLCVACCLL